MYRCGFRGSASAVQVDLDVDARCWLGRVESFLPILRMEWSWDCGL